MDALYDHDTEDAWYVWVWIDGAWKEMSEHQTEPAAELWYEQSIRQGYINRFKPWHIGTNKPTYIPRERR